MKQIALVMMVIVLAACAPQPVAPAKGKVKNFGVSLEAKPSQGTVKILSKPQGEKKAGEKNGYMGFAQGESGNVLFTVKKEDLADNCDGTAEWVITQIALTAYGDENNEKGDETTFDKPQPPWLKEAFPDTDPDKNGYVLNVAKDQAQTFAIVQNDNAQGGEQVIYYRVTLSPCDDQSGKLTPLETDPMIRNGGREF